MLNSNQSMIKSSTTLRSLLGPLNNAITLNLLQKRNIREWPETKYQDHFMPQNEEDRLLPPVEHTPSFYPDQVTGPLKVSKRNIDMRGPERIHNQLIYRRYGIIALGGGSLTGVHFDMVRDRINKYMDTSRFFAIWRVDPPWKSVTRKGSGKTLGGGKAKVHHFETPIRAGRIIVEVGGPGQFQEVERLLTELAKRLPFYARSISQEIMDQIKEEKLQIDARNYNPFTFREVVNKNFSDTNRILSPYDVLWGPTYF